MKPALLCALTLVAMLLVRAVGAHDFRPGVLALVEREPGRFAIAWNEPVDSLAREPVTFSVPDHCVHDARSLSCGERGIDGDIVFEHLPAGARVVVSIEWRDGRSLEHVVLDDEPRLSVTAPPSAFRWVRIGAEHVLGGLDHLAFLVGLLLLLRPDRRLIATITAFTLAHSLTLALSVLGVLELPSGPVEASIAVSVMLVAHESLSDRENLTRRAPWVVAFLFGLVHGLGFAGALRELGLPEHAVGWTLLWFNVGVEVGQLTVVAAVMLVGLLGGRILMRRRRVRVAAAYVLGTLGAWWLVERTLAILGLG
jgi:hypothetical protein